MWLRSSLSKILDRLLNLIELLLGEGHLQGDLHVLTLLRHLVIDEETAEGLAEDDVDEPPDQIVRVTTDHVLKLSLEHHAGDVRHHKEEGSKVKDAEDASDDVLVEGCADRERD